MPNSSIEKKRDSSVGSDYKIINEERINSKKCGKGSHGQGIIAEEITTKFSTRVQGSQTQSNSLAESGSVMERSFKANQRAESPVGLCMSKLSLRKLPAGV